MAKIDKVQEVSLKKLHPYPNNAKKHSADQVQKIADSISEFGFLSPCLIDKEYNVIAGHGRLQAAELLGMRSVPCVFIEGLTERQKRAYILADNKLTELGEWDQVLLNEELAFLQDEDFDVELTGFEISGDWFSERERWDNSREEGNEEYNAFLDKFEDPKTTDDCYTPDNIYEALADWVRNEYNVNKTDFIRPFYPGGDYQSEDYTGKIVVDNPPFSILAQIVDFYVGRKIPFFIFRPVVTLMCYAGKPVSLLCTNCSITYENKATVQTGFITNMEPPEIARKSTPGLFEIINKVNEENLAKLKANLPKYSYPDQVVTRSIMGKWSKYGVEQVFKRKDSVHISELDAMKDYGKKIYGDGLLLSEKAAAEKATAEKNAVKKETIVKPSINWELSECEWDIVHSLGGDNDQA